MAEPVMTDDDVLALVRKEFERKIADYCEKHGIEPEKQEADETPDEVGDEEDNDTLGKRNPPSAPRSEEINVDKLKNSIGIRVSHRDSGLEYYLRGVNTANQIVDLETPEGTLFQVDFQELEDEYKLG